MPLDILPTARPHDCPSTCAKVARYAERVQHPDRLSQPLHRAGAAFHDTAIRLWAA